MVHILLGALILVSLAFIGSMLASDARLLTVTDVMPTAAPTTPPPSATTLSTAVPLRDEAHLEALRAAQRAAERVRKQACAAAKHLPHSGGVTQEVFRLLPADSPVYETWSMADFTCLFGAPGTLVSSVGTQHTYGWRADNGGVLVLVLEESYAEGKDGVYRIRAKAQQDLP